MAPFRTKKPAAPAGFDAAKFFAGRPWFQRWEMFDGVFTPGLNPVEEILDAVGLPHDLTGKRVLDIGPWHGCASLECERRGAREVVALGPEDPEQTGFPLLRDAVGSTRVRYQRGSVYHLDPARLGHFDVVLFLGVLYHLRYPLLGIDNLRRVCTGDLYAETFVADDQVIQSEDYFRKPMQLGRLSRTVQALPVWQFFRLDELDGDSSNWFAPTTTAVVQALQSAGFDAECLRHRKVGTNRACFQARVKGGVPEFLTIGSNDGENYDQVIGNLLGDGRPGADSEPEHFLAGVLACDDYYHAAGSPENWVHKAAHAVFARPARAEEIQAALARGAATADRRLTLTTEWALSREHRERQVVGHYQRFLKRTPGRDEIDHWTGPLLRGATSTETVANFLGSDEYFKNAAGGDNRKWLDQVYLELLGRPRDKDSKKYVNALTCNSSRRFVAVLIQDTMEHHRRVLDAISQRHLGRPAAQARLPRPLALPAMPPARAAA